MPPSLFLPTLKPFSSPPRSAAPRSLAAPSWPASFCCWRQRMLVLVAAMLRAVRPAHHWRPGSRLPSRTLRRGLSLSCSRFHSPRAFRYCTADSGNRTTYFGIQPEHTIRDPLPTSASNFWVSVSRISHRQLVNSLLQLLARVSLTSTRSCIRSPLCLRVAVASVGPASGLYGLDPLPSPGGVKM